MRSLGEVHIIKDQRLSKRIFEASMGKAKEDDWDKHDLKTLTEIKVIKREEARALAK